MSRSMTTQTSDEEGSAKIYIEPVPASRPRVPRFGRPFYVGRYKEFRQELELAVADVPPWLPDGPVHVQVMFICKKPKKPTNPYPKGDIDNYIKAIWDGLNGKWGFKDDRQIVSVEAEKRYAKIEEEPHILILVWRKHDHKEGSG